METLLSAPHYRGLHKHCPWVADSRRGTVWSRCDGKLNFTVEGDLLGGHHGRRHFSLDLGESIGLALQRGKSFQVRVASAGTALIPGQGRDMVRTALIWLQAAGCTGEWRGLVPRKHCSQVGLSHRGPCLRVKEMDMWREGQILQMLHSKNPTASKADWLLGSNAKGTMEISSGGWGACQRAWRTRRRSGRWSLGRRPRVRREARQGMVRGEQGPAVS